MPIKDLLNKIKLIKQNIKRLVGLLPASRLCLEIIVSLLLLFFQRIRDVLDA